MADVTKVKASDGTIYDINDVNDYTKDETDVLLAGKADVGDSYTKAEDDALLAAKADSSSVDSALALKANVVDVYSKTEADNLLAGKANVGVSYTKAEDDALLAAKADTSSLDNYTLKATFVQFQGDVNVEFQNRYTKAEDDALLGNKANSSDVYTKAEVDALIGGIKMMPLLDWANPIWTSATASDTFTATGKCYLYGWIQGGGEVGIMVNGGEVSVKSGIGTTDAAATPFPVELVAGDVVTFNNATAYPTKVHVYVERS